jgi:small-conductance mechanosensitive channel
MSVEACQVGVVMLHEAIKAGDISLPVVAILLALALVLWCDVAFVMDAWMLRRNRDGLGEPSRRSSSWLVWVAALALSLYLFAMSVLGMRAYRLHGRLDILLTGVVLSSVVLWFDVALAVHAVKSRARRAE